MFEFEHNLLYTDSETGLPVLGNQHLSNLTMMISKEIDMDTG